MNNVYNPVNIKNVLGNREEVIHSPNLYQGVQQNARRNQIFRFRQYLQAHKLCQTMQIQEIPVSR